MSEPDLRSARDALIAAGITGPHQSHSRDKNIAKLHALVDGRDPEAAFGLSGIEGLDAAQVLGWMSELTGCPDDVSNLACEDSIDPDRTIGAIVAAAERLLDAARRGDSLLAVTGHPTGLLEHHMHVVDAYQRAGGKLCRLREEDNLDIRGKRGEVRYIGGVGCLADWGNLKHTHSSAAMEELLAEQPWPDIVLGDHGFAGAAIERGIPVVAVMDINDPALAVAWGRGADVTVIPMDDNRPPRLYEPSWQIFEAIIESP
jgi:Phosphatase